MRTVLALGLGAAASLGCSKDATNQLASKRNALRPTLSAPFYLEDLELVPADQAGNLSHGVSFVCGTTRCLVLYTLALHSTTATFVRRTDAQGAILDAQPQRLPSRMEILGARGDEFLLMSDSQGAFLLDGSDGSLRDVSASIPPNTFAATGANDRWLIQTIEGDTLHERLLDENLAAVGNVHAVTPILTTGVLGSHVAAGGGYFLLYWDGGAVRVRASDGALLDTTPLAYSRYNHNDPRATYKDGVFQLVWGNGQDLFGSRIRASDGVILDPDDTFNQVSGARLLCHRCGGGGSVSNWQLNDVGDDGILVTWLQATDTLLEHRLVGARVDVATGVRVDNTTSGAEFNIQNVGAVGYELRLTAAQGLLFTSNTVSAATYLSSPSPGVVVAPGNTLAVSSKTRKDLALAYGASQYLAVWRVDNNFHAGDNLYATRVDAVTGKYLDAPPLALGYAQGVPSVVWTGAEFLVASLDSGGFRARIVHPNGTLGNLVGPLTMAATDPAGYSSLQMISNGDKVLAAWIYQERNYRYVVALRLDASAQPLSGPTIVMDRQPGDFALMADTTPAPNRRSFVIAASSAPDNEILAVRLRADSGAVIRPWTSLGHGFLLHGGSNGTSLLLQYQEASAPFRQTFGLLDPLDGTWTTGPKAYDWWTESWPLQAWFDDRSFQILKFTHDYEYKVFRLDGALNPLDPTAPAPGMRVTTPRLAIPDSCKPVAASSGSGRSLLIDCEPDPDRFGIATKARWLDNDGGPSTVGDGGAAGAPSSSGGEAGDTGATGNGGMNSGGTSSAGTHSGGSESGDSGGRRNDGGAATMAGAAGDGGELGTAMGGSGAAVGAGGTSVSAGGSDSGGKDANQQAGGSTSGGRFSGDAAGGTTAMGGATNVGEQQEGESSGCSCKLVPNDRRNTRMSLASLALIALVARRRRSSRRP